MTSWRAWTVGVMIALVAGCSTSTPEPPTAPSPQPGPPVLTCPATVTVPAQLTTGARVPFPAPVVTGGRSPITVTCTPGSEELFPVGPTTVSCSAIDVTGATASCTFRVEVTGVPRLSRTAFMAFGDSVTAGEVTVPVATGARQIVVPSSSYPAVLQGRLRQRYLADAVTVVNTGRSGEFAADAFPRFQAAMLANRPQAVLLLMGFNDLESSATVTSAVRAMERMAQEARGRGARLFLGTLTPSIQGRSRSQSDVLIRQFNSAIRSLAVGEGAVLVDLYQAASLNVTAWIGPDGLHPTEAGYVRIAEQFQAAIQTDLEMR